MTGKSGSNLTDAAQLELTIRTIKARMIVAPAALLLVVLLIVRRYRLDSRLHRQIRAELFDRGAGA